MSASTRVGSTAVPLFVGLALLGAAMTSGKADPGSAADPAAQGPVRCEIQKSTAGGGLSLKAVVYADVAVSGSYMFKVAGGSNGNSSNINQGGPFDAKGTVTLGQVMLSPGAKYTATLTVMANGTTVACTEPA